MFDKLNFDAIIQHLHEYAEGGYIDIHDIHMAMAVVTASNVSPDDSGKVLQILVDLKLIGDSAINPGGGTVMKFRLL